MRQPRERLPLWFVTLMTFLVGIAVFGLIGAYYMTLVAETYR